MAATLWHRQADDQAWIEGGSDGTTAAAGTILELAVALSELGLRSGSGLAFFVAAYDPRGNEIERHPQERLVELTVPDERFEARNWTA